MTSCPIVIYGLRISEDMIRNHIAQLEANNPDFDFGGYEDWDLQTLANNSKLPLIVVRRAYHDGETSHRDYLIENCPVYIAFSSYSGQSFNPHDLLIDLTQLDFSHLNDLLLYFGAPDGDYQFAFQLDTYDIDAGYVTYIPQSQSVFDDNDNDTEDNDSMPDSP